MTDYNGFPFEQPKEEAEVYRKGTNVRDIKKFDRSMKVIFECKEHPGIHYMSKEPSWSNWFPANDEARDIEFGTKQDPCPHKVRDDVWVIAVDYLPFH